MAHFNLGLSSTPSMPKNYEIFEHTADIGMRITGKDLKELFKNAGLAIFQISSRKQFTKDKTHTLIRIKQKAGNLEELFVNWLNELLSLSAARSLIFHDIKITKLEDNEIEASCTGSNNLNYKVNIEIKAATYCDLKVEKLDSGWAAKVVLDV
jgi:SHS2 domain-containing protein